MFQGEEQARRDAHDQRMAEREAKELQSGKRLRGRAPALPEPVKERQANVTS